MNSIFARPKRAAGAAGVAAAGIAMIVGGAVPSASAAPLPNGAGAPLGMCAPEGGFPWIDGTTPEQPQVHDTGVNTYVGGDFTVTGSAEAEGLVVVAGDMHIDRSFIVGIAIGSDIRPAPGETQLQVGGDVTAASGSVLHVGDLAVAGGAVKIGGSVASGVIQNGAASLETGLTAPIAVAPHGSLSDAIAGWSSALAGHAPNGSVSSTPGWVDLQLTGTGEDELQVFDITAAQLASANQVSFLDIAPHAPIVVNVTGAGVEMKASSYAYNGSAFTAMQPGDGNIAASILWNFQDATDARIGGSTQVPGSFLAPTADAEVSASTNGRMYVGGNLLASGAGNELHAYPWAGTCDDNPNPGADADADAGGADADADGASADADADGAGADADADGAGADADADGAGADADADGAAADADANGADADADGANADAAADGANADAAADAADAGADGGTADAQTSATASASTSAAGSASTDPVTAGDALATTGGQAPMWLLGGGAVVLLGGLTLLASARARRNA